MAVFTLCAPCLFGLEGILSHEVQRIGGEQIQVTDGRVLFQGDEALIAHANIGLRTAERVGIVLGRFDARSFTELFDQVAELPFEAFIGRDDAFPVKGWSLKSQLHSIPDCQSIIKKAVVRRLESAYHQSWFQETGPVHQIQFSILQDNVTILLDTSGPGLHKRGYRAGTGLTAPIKETLAAGIVDLARVRSGSTVVDPMCGSGTLLIEAALRAFRIAPGLRRKFAAEQWDSLDSKIWKQERDRALEAVDRSASFQGIGSDIDPEAVRLTSENANRAGVGKKVSVVQADLADFRIPDGKAIVLCNPPYGERLLEIDQARALYRTAGHVMRRNPGGGMYWISPDEQFEQLYGRRADKRRKLYNGNIRCQLYMYYK